MRNTMIIGKPTFRVQRTRNAHTSPPESEFYTVCTCRTLRGLRMRWKKLRQDQQVCGPGSWAFNLRILVTCIPADLSEIRGELETYDLMPFAIFIEPLTLDPLSECGLEHLPRATQALRGTDK
jgi:hypothetical protein|tara:strand:+ start:1755 stop:2123 length:369 start_codon:yes stop_codon:yes gene_type:complete